ncbi:MAG: hypothetical protein WCF17_03180 [Terracidiphilus sp.]
MSGFLTIFVLVLLLLVAAFCAVMVLRMVGTLQFPQGDAWPYAQRRFATRGHRGLLRELGEAGKLEGPAA